MEVQDVVWALGDNQNQRRVEAKIPKVGTASGVTFIKKGHFEIENRVVGKKGEGWAVPANVRHVVLFWREGTDISEGKKCGGEKSLLCGTWAGDNAEEGNGRVQDRASVETLESNQGHEGLN